VPRLLPFLGVFVLLVTIQQLKVSARSGNTGLAVSLLVTYIYSMYWEFLGWGSIIIVEHQDEGSYGGFTFGSGLLDHYLAHSN
jgi:hypothetical protein